MADTIVHTLNHKGFPVHVKEYARGTCDIPLVVIGGAFQNIAQIERMSGALAKHTWVIAFDTPGNGETGVLPYNYTFEFIAECIAAALEKLQVRKINLVGFSYGSIIALRFVQQYKAMVSRLTLLGAMHRIPERLIYEFNLMLFYLKWDKQEAFADSFTNLMSNPELRETNKLARLAGEKLHYALTHANEGIREQFIHNTKRILKHGNTDLSLLPDVRTLVSTGEHDIFVPPAANKLIADAFPRGRYVSIDGADHMVHVIQFKKTINTILAGSGVIEIKKPLPTIVLSTENSRYSAGNSDIQSSDIPNIGSDVEPAIRTTH